MHIESQTSIFITDTRLNRFKHKGKVVDSKGKEGEKEERAFDLAQARIIYNILICQDYVDDEGALTAAYHEAKRNGTLDFGKVNEYRDGIMAALDTVFNPSSIKPEDARKPKAANFRKDNFDKKEFQNLWKRINNVG